MSATITPPAPPLVPERSARRRLLLLTATRWLPVGFLMGLTVLLPLERGIPLAQVGVLMSIQGFVVLALELPTGGLADSIGRRPLLLVAGSIAVASTVLFVLADSFWWFAVAILLQGVFRSLDSGPLESWYVDIAVHEDPDAAVDGVLSKAGTVLGLAIAGGALVGGLVVAWHPFPGWTALGPPFVLAAAVMVLHLVLTAVLVREAPRHDGGALRTAVRETPAVIAGGVRLVTRSRVLLGLVLVEVFWAVAMIAFESLTPVRLGTLLGSEAAAGAVFGPASAAAWALFAAGSAGAPLLRRMFGLVGGAIAARILNGAFVVMMGLLAGPVGLLIGYGAAYLSHGLAGPLHSALLHAQGTSANRTMILSLNSLVSGGAYSLGLLVLMPLADRFGTPVAFVVAGSFSVLGALCYLPALRAARLSRAPDLA